MENSYNLISNQWSELRRKATINQCIVDFCQLLDNNASILDIGCGDGFIDGYLNDCGFKVTAIDPSSNMIELAKGLHLSNVEFINSGLFEFLATDKFDAIIAFDSLWHIPLHQQTQIYSKLSSLMQDNAYLIFTHGKNDGEHIDKIFNQEFYTERKKRKPLALAKGMNFKL